jgi:uncharacterized damage-inducible protein DinB
MVREVPALSKVLDELHADIDKIIEPLTDEHINWVHPHLSNTVGNLLRHIAGSERYWIGEVIGGQPANRVRDSEFVRETLAKGPLVDDLHRTHTSVRSILDGLTVSNLLDEVDVRRGGQRMRVSKAWAAVHALTHTAYHLGQLQLFRKMAFAGKGS